MRCVSYNIQYGIGLDRRYEIARIADAVRGADVIALQEVSRNNPMNGSHDMVAAIRASRNLLLPRSRSFDRLNFQRGALEALIETPLGFVRFYSTHLDHRGADERLAQVGFLKERILGFPLEGGALSGVAEMGFAEPPHTDAFVLMGDFNMLAGAPEYALLAGRPDHEFGTPLVANLAVDAAARLGQSGDNATTWVDPKRPDDRTRWKRIDYVFTSASLAASLKSCQIDREAVGSDHLPVWVEMG